MPATLPPKGIIMPPPSSGIFKILGRSPIHPLQDHIAAVDECAQQLIPFMHAVMDNNWQVAENIQNQIADLENRADKIKVELRLNLPKSLFLPFPRSDILELLASQDSIADVCRDIAGLMLGRQMNIPEPIEADYLAFLKRSIDAVDQAQKAINQLDELLETGFRGSEVNVVEDMIHQLAAIEHDTDEMQISLRRSLYKIEKDYSAIDIMFLYKIIDWTGRIADTAERVGGRLQLLLAQ